jgi:hypothetical protein
MQEEVFRGLLSNQIDIPSGFLVDLGILGGHRQSVVRVRVGQPTFRRELLKRYGATCAFTGPQPTDALDAAHMYSYASFGEHDLNAGFLLRADLHRLFDRGLITVNPVTLKLDLHPSLRTAGTYSPLQGQPLRISPATRARELLAGHWSLRHGH